MNQAVIRVVRFRRQFEAVRASPQLLEQMMGTSLIIQDCHGEVCTLWKPLSKTSSLDALSLDTEFDAYATTEDVWQAITTTRSGRFCLFPYYRRSVYIEKETGKVERRTLRL